MGFGESLFPISAFRSAHDHVIVANHLRSALGIQAMQVIFDFILMGNQDVTFGTIMAGIFQVNRVERVNMNHQRHFLLRGLAFALLTAGKAHVAIQVEEEFIARGKFAKKGGFVGYIFAASIISPFLRAQHICASPN